MAARHHEIQGEWLVHATDGELLERDAELVALRAAVAAARRRAGALVVIQGPAGAGKSTLLSAAEACGQAAGVLVLSGRGRELERTVALGVAVDLLAPPVRAASAPERARLLDGLAAPAGRLLLEPATEPLIAADTALLGLCLVAAHLAGWNHHAGTAGPLLIAVDDVQWADAPSLRFLAMLADRADRLPLSLVVSAREGEPAADTAALRRLTAHPRARVLTPAPLTAAAVSQLTAAAFPEADPGLAAAVAHASGGNPFFTVELLRSLRAGARAPEAVAHLMPGAVLRSVLTRLARLPDDAGRLAVSLAVLGDGAPLRRAAGHAGLTVTAAERAADLLAGAWLLRPGRPLAFAHPIISDAIQADLPGFARARAHRKAADLLAADGESAGRVAGHLLAAEPEGDPGSVAVLSEAAGWALGRGDPASAARFLRRALAEPPPAPQRAGLLMKLAHAEMAAGQATAHGPLIEALGLLRAADVHARAEALSMLARIYHARGELDRAAAASTRALGLLDPRDRAWQDALADFLAVATFHPPLQASADRWVTSVLRDARQGRLPDHARLLAHVALRLAIAGDPPEAVRDPAARALAADPLVDPADHGALFGLVAHALVIAGETAAAEAAADTALAESKRRGDLLAQSSASFHRALSRFHQGALTAALADLEAAIRNGTDAGWNGAVGWVAALAAEIHLDLGNHAAAGDALRQAGPRPPDSMDAPLVAHARARLALADHDPATALAVASDAGRQLWETFRIDHPGLLPWRLTAALAAHHLGDHGQAARLAAAALDRARSTGIAAALGAALRVTGLVAHPRPDTALLAEAVTTLATTTARLEHAQALVDLGAALRRDGQREASRRPLRDGLALASRLHARPLADRAGAELRAAGARPRRSALTGIDALTSAERRVALLALHGDGNAAIAQTLFVSTKTVETHLSHAYRKLGITGRRQLHEVFGSMAGRIT
jgi:DNA-binding CsgD family transcriptional regulator